MVDHARIRVTLFKNCQNPQNGQDVLLNPHAAREEIYELCSNTLGIQAAKVFSDSGFLLNNFNSLRDGAVLYVSQGEHFQVRQPAATPGTGSRKYSLVMLGTAAVGKSAITLDQACRIATGNPWAGLKVEPGAVFIVAGEGHVESLARRI